MGVPKEKEERQLTDSFKQRSKGAASIPTDELIPSAARPPPPPPPPPQVRRSRDHHSLIDI